jgi:hypothetical protein
MKAANGRAYQGDIGGLVCGTKTPRSDRPGFRLSTRKPANDPRPWHGTDRYFESIRQRAGHDGTSVLSGSAPGTLI